MSTYRQNLLSRREEVSLRIKEIRQRGLDDPEYAAGVQYQKKIDGWYRELREINLALDDDNRQTGAKVSVRRGFT